MELIWKELDAERLIAAALEQVHIAGDLPTPDGRTPGDVLLCRAKVVAENTVIDAGRVTVEGRITAQLTVSNDEGLFAYESSAGFRHEILMPDAAPGMSAAVVTQVQTQNAVVISGGARIEADVDMDVRLMSSVPLRAIGGISGADDLELKTVTRDCSVRRKLGSDTLRLREELTADSVDRIISCEGFIHVRDVVMDQSAATVSGMITVSAITSSTDGHNSMIVRQAPFRERIAIGDTADKVYCTAELLSINLRPLGEEFGLISMEAEASFIVYGVSEKQIEIPVDAFSPTIGFDCLHDRAVMLDRLGAVSAAPSFKEQIELPDTAADMEEPAFVSVRPIVTETVMAEHGIKVSGLLETSVAYESTAGTMHVFREDVPFETQIDALKADRPIVSAACIASVNGFTEREIQIRYDMLINAELNTEEENMVLVGLAEKDAKEKQSGIFICAASEGEGYFDIAKRYGVSSRTVMELNPDSSEPFSEGEKLLLLM